MPRITYADRFAALLAKDYLSDRDRTFAESLSAHYQRKKALTAGRRRCFLQLEERYATPPVADDEMVARIQGLQARMGGEGSQWATNFTQSLLSQARSGASLSARQVEVLEGIEAEWTETEVATRQSWDQDFTPEMAERFRVMTEYYGKNGYFQNIVRARAANPEMIPSQRDYERVTSNKYASKVLAGWFDAPVYEVGSMVSLRSSASRSLRHKLPSGLAVIIAANAEVPTRACRGNKVYKLLPIGSSQTVLADECDLKKARASRKKKK